MYLRTQSLFETRRFIAELRKALKNATQRGGGYSAFFHDDTGEVILQLEIAPKVRAK